MKLKMISEGSLASIGHVALDVAGLVPGIGEPADLANALWYAKEGDYLSSCLSLLSMVPEIGDALGKGLKYLGKSSSMVQRLLVKYGDDVAKYWPVVKSKLSKIDEWEPFLRDLDNTIRTVLSNTGNAKGL